MSKIESTGESGERDREKSSKTGRNSRSKKLKAKE